MVYIEVEQYRIIIVLIKQIIQHDSKVGSQEYF